MWLLGGREGSYWLLACEEGRIICAYKTFIGAGWTIDFGKGIHLPRLSRSLSSGKNGRLHFSLRNLVRTIDEFLNKASHTPLNPTPTPETPSLTSLPFLQVCFKGERYFLVPFCKCKPLIWQRLPNLDVVVVVVVVRRKKGLVAKGGLEIFLFLFRVDS